MRRRRKLTYKLLVGVIPVISVMAVITLFALTGYFKHAFQSMIEAYQFNLASRTAEKLEDQLETLQKTVISIAQILPTEKLNDPKAIEQFLSERPNLKHMFDNNVVVFSPEGSIIAELNERPSRTGMDLSFREYIVKTRENWKPYISSPFKTSRSKNHPVVMFTAPVFDKSGKPAAIVGGSLDLYSSNLLGRLAEARIGKEGYYYLTDGNRLMIMHPERERIMTVTPAKGINKLYDKALEGFEGGGQTVNTRGTQYIAAFKRIKLTGWILAAQIPTSEAFALVDKAFTIGWIITLTGLALTALLIFLSTKRLTTPLELLAAQIHEISGGNALNPITIRQDDEVGDLATAFTSMMRQLQARERDLQSSRELYQFLSDFSSDWIFWRVPTGEMIYISPAAEKITGYSVNELISSPNLSSAIIHPDDQSLWESHVCRANEAVEEAIEYRIIHKDGSIRWISHTCRAITDNEGHTIGVRGCNTDITASKVAETALKESEERFRLIASAAHDAIVMTDKGGIVTFWNDAAARIFGINADKAIGRSIDAFIKGVNSNEANCFLDLLFAPVMQKLSGWSIEAQGVSHNNSADPVLEVSVSTARLTGKTYAILLIRDITERKEAEEQLQYLSTHDTLTGLHNRAYFESELTRLKTSDFFPVSIIVADLDGLKSANDTLGHDAGDQLIREAAKLLDSNFRIVDTVARIGGDEFAVLLPGMNEKMATEKVHRLKQLILLSQNDENLLNVSMSIGTATAHAADQLDEALKEADHRMYQDKFSRKTE